MTFLILCVLAIVQGLTEFLPISSSGHLILFENLFGINSNLCFLNLFFHLASLLAIIVFYRKTILKLIKKPFQPLTYKLLITSLFTFIIAIFYKFANLQKFETTFYKFGFLITALILLFCNFIKNNRICLIKSQPSYFDSFVCGIVQGLAIFPGISRSGATISCLIFRRNNETTSAEYSFLISIPVIIGGFFIELFSINKSNFVLNISLIEYLSLFLITFICAYLSLKFISKILKNNNLVCFSVYLIILFFITLII